MRINVISFLNPWLYGGGGEMVTRALLETGAQRGHQFRITSARPRERASFRDADFTLAVDLMNGGHTWKSLGAWRHFGERWLNAALTEVPYVHFTNAYADVCRLPYLPCSGNRPGSRCSFAKDLGLGQKSLLRFRGDTCSALWDSTTELYAGAAMNVFVSPLHQRITYDLLGDISLPPALILRPIVDTTRFKNEHGERDIEFLFVGVVSEAKGLSEMKERFGNRLTLAGDCHPDAKVDFGTYLGRVDYARVPALMNRAENFVFLPRWPEPQGRVVVEASLCGCNVIGNSNVGALSFSLDLSDPSSCDGAETDFWVTMEEFFGGLRD